MTRKMVLWSIALFFAGFVALAALLRLLVPSPLDLHADMRSEKLLLMQQWQGKANAAMFGSSHMNYGFDPRVFDATLAGSPYAEKTINLAVSGGAQTEQRRMALRFVKQLKPVAGVQTPPLVMLELNAGANLTNDHLVHPRSINLYDLSTLRFAWSLVSNKMSRSQSLGRRGYALAATALYSMNMGMLSSRIFSAPIDEKRMVDQSVDDRRGEEVELVTDKERQFVREMAASTAWKSETRPGLLVPANRMLAEELQRASAVPGLQVAYVVSAKLDDPAGLTTYPPCIHTAGGDVPILSVARPDLYPDLFRDSTNWFDDTHMTEKGAVVASRGLAEQWLAWKQHPTSGCED